MKIAFNTALYLLCFLILACNHQENRIKPNVVGLPNTLPTGDTLVMHRSKTVSLVNLIATPERYDGKKLRVIGYLHLEFEGSGLYLHKEDYDLEINKNAIWVDVNEKHPEIGKLSKFSNQYVIIEGTFDSNMRRHMDANSGGIKNITRLELWPISQAKS